MILLCPYVPPQPADVWCVPVIGVVELRDGKLFGERFRIASYRVGTRIEVEVIPVHTSSFE